MEGVGVGGSDGEVVRFWGVGVFLGEGGLRCWDGACQDECQSVVVIMVKGWSRALEFLSTFGSTFSEREIRRTGVLSVAYALVWRCSRFRWESCMLCMRTNASRSSQCP